MGIQIEPVNGGLVTARDPALLQPGELTRCENGVYRPYSQSVHKMPSRSTFNSTPLSGAVTGLRYCAFDFVQVTSVRTVSTTLLTAISGSDYDGVSDGARVYGDGIPDGTTVVSHTSSTVTMSANATTSGESPVLFDADDLLIAQNANAYWKAIAGSSGTFSSIASVTEGDSLESVHYANKHVLMNGKNANLVLKSDGSTRAHGLEPVTETPLVVVSSGGTWNLSTGIGFYSYWTTEYDKVNDVESTFTGKPGVANVTALTQLVTITRPQQVNTSATHWRLYRSVKMTSSTTAGATKEVVFPAGFLIGEAQIAADGTQLTLVDGTTTPSTATSTGATTVVFNTGWTNPTNATGAANGTVASLAAGLVNRTLGLGTFGIGTVGSGVTGVVLTVTARKTGTTSTGLSVRPLTRRQITKEGGGLLGVIPLPSSVYISPKPIPLTTSLASYTIGSSSDTWGINWLPDDFSNTNFFVEFNGTTGSAATLEIDSVTVTIHYNAAQQEGTTDPFPAITITAYGVEASVGRNGPPPKATTGDIFQDSLCLNDVEDESLMRYSFPTLVDYFPGVYYINFETKDQDAITNIKTVGNVLVIGLRTQLYRCNFLPREQDAEFDRGRAIELIEANHGIVGRHAATLLSGVEGSQMLAYVSRYGLHLTDGYRVRWATMDLDWEREVDVTYLSKVVLINNPENYELLMFYVPVDAAYTTYPSKCLRFNYHPMHIKEGGYLKISGPCDYTEAGRRVPAAALAVLPSGARPLYAASETGVVHVENGTSTTTGLQLSVQTREMYNAGFGNEWRYDDLYVHSTLGSTTAGATTMSTQLLVNKTGATERTTTAKTYDLAAFAGSGAFPRRRDLGSVVNNQTGEGIMTLVQTPSAFTARLALDYMVIGWEEQQEEDS